MLLTLISRKILCKQIITPTEDVEAQVENVLAQPEHVELAQVHVEVEDVETLAEGARLHDCRRLELETQSP